MDALIGRLPRHLQGQAWMLAACVVFALLWTAIRWASETLHPFVVAFYRCFFGLITLLPMLVVHHRTVLATSRFPIHLRRATSGMIAMLATFYAIANAPLATVMSINYAAPLFATIAAVLFLGERIRARRMIALAVGFTGILVVMRPGAVPLSAGVVAAMLSAVATAASIVSVKQLTQTDDPRAVVAYSFLLMLPPAFIVALFFWQWPSWQELGILALVGVTASLAQTALVRAFSLAEATAVLPLDFFRLVLVVIIGIVVFGEAFDGWTVLGGVIILASTIYVAHREAAAARAIKPASQPPLT